MTATQRGALMRKLGDLIAREAGNLAETDVRFGLAAAVCINSGAATANPFVMR